MKHTQGEWTIENPRGTHHIKCEGKEIARVTGVNKTFDCKKAEANAKLIASAPDLLKALKTCLHTLRNTVNNGDADNTILLTEKAIKKATL